MPKVVTKGLLQIAIAPLAGDGGPGTVFTGIGYTSRDAETNITTGEPTVEEFFANETDTPIETTTTPGTTTFTFSLFLLDEDDMILWMGGSKTGTGTGPDPYVWSSGDVSPELKRTIRFTPRSGRILTFNHVNLNTLLNYDLSPTGKMLLTVTGTVLQPTKAGVPKSTQSLPVVA